MEKTDESIGSRLEIVRKRKGLTQKQAAELLGKAPRSVQNHESGRHRPPDSLINMYAEVYGCDKEWLLTGQGAPGIRVKRSPMTPRLERSRLKDGDGLYGRTRRHQVDGKDFDVTVHAPGGEDDGVDSFARAVTGLREIFDSEDPILVPAIEANIRAFRISVHRERQIYEQNKRIKVLEDECDELKDRLENLEKKLDEKLDRGGGRAAGGSQ